MEGRALSRPNPVIIDPPTDSCSPPEVLAPSVARRSRTLSGTPSSRLCRPSFRCTFPHPGFVRSWRPDSGYCSICLRHKLRERGPLLITHNGVSGPAILRLSAWGARVLHGLDYNFTLRVNWLPDFTEEAIRAQLQSLRQSNPNRLVTNSPLAPLPARLWEQLALSAGIDRETRWTTLSRVKANALAQVLTHTELEVNGKSLNKDEFVTCGGVSLREINFKTMESRITPGLYFAGELLDLDGVTGGFNFQAAWTTGWIAGHAMADPPGSQLAAMKRRRLRSKTLSAR